MWWRTAVFYEIYVRSFQDADGDGVGDLAGIIDRLDYLNDGTPTSLGVDALWLTPINPSPLYDFGYDVSDYTAVDPRFGTLADLDRLVAAAHQRGMRIILDLVPNHTSCEHPWFRSARQSRTAATRDWYVWADPHPDGGPPNNWVSSFAGPAWTYDETTRQYYLHSFLPQQPDLNYHNPAVVEAIEGVREGYFDAFDRRRAPIVIAGLEGAEYPMSAWEWIDQVGEAIAPIRRLGEVAGAVTRQLAVRHAAESKRQMVVSVVILALTLLGGGLSIWVVLRRIVRPISHITRTMTALARGHQIVAVPSTDQIGEIGDMARALQVFKEKAEHEVSGIVEAYTRLQQLSESLMRETSNILSQLELILMEDKQPSDSDRTALAPGATVLLIEGDAAERERLVRLVSDNGHHAVAANGGHQGLGILDDEDVDLVLLALDNPEVDGPAIVAHMHESPRLQGIPIIAVSDAADAEATPSSLDLGTADLLSRSCEPALLMARMEVALERRRLRQREQAYRDRLAAGKKTFEELLRAIEPQLVAAGTRAKEGAFEIGDRDLKLKREIEAVLEDAEQRMAANKSLTTRSLARILARSGKHRFSEQTLRQIIDRRYPPLRRLGIIGHDERTARMPQGGRAIPS